MPQQQYAQPPYQPPAVPYGQYQQNPYGQGPNQVDMGDKNERMSEIIKTLQQDTSFLDSKDKESFYTWGRLSKIGTIGVFGTMLIPIGLLLSKKFSREQKAMYLRYGVLVQALVGG